MSEQEIHQAALDAFGAQDFVRATEVLEPLARAGDVNALALPGTLHTLPGMLDSEKAIRYLTAAARQGGGLAAHSLATLYRDPAPTHTNYPAACSAQCHPYSPLRRIPPP